MCSRSSRLLYPKPGLPELCLKSASIFGDGKASQWFRTGQCRNFEKSPLTPPSRSVGNLEAARFGILAIVQHLRVLVLICFAYAVSRASAGAVETFLGFGRRGLSNWDNSSWVARSVPRSMVTAWDSGVGKVSAAQLLCCVRKAARIADIANGRPFQSITNPFTS